MLRHELSCGQSAAVRTGVRTATGKVVATLDGDGQNDPAFIPTLFAALETAGPEAGLAAGQRVARKDGAFKTMQSRIANGVRARILRDGTRDTGCGLKVFRRDAYLAVGGCRSEMEPAEDNELILRLLQRGVKFVENATNLDQLAMARPGSCTAVVGAPKHVRGTGGPSRVLALCER